jgi:hypothetical protein
MPEARIRIEVSDDRLNAHAVISQGEAENLDDLDRALAEAGVTHGIDEEVRERIGEGLADAEFQEARTCIASGSAPETGEDGRLELRFKVGIAAGTERGDGTLDLRDRGMLKPVSDGDPIALRHPPEPGTPGCGVDGKSIEATAGKDDLTTVGEGATEDACGEICAARDGVIQYQAHRLIDVTDHHIHSGDVDVRSGNLKTKGSLTVRGDILIGSTASAEADVEITGKVDNGSVCAGGNIQIVGGLIGGEGGSLSAEGDVGVRHVQNGVVTCGGDLAVSTDAVGGTLRSRSLRLEGRMIGGSAKVEEILSVDQAGSAMGTGTRLAAAQLLERPVIAAHASLKEAGEQGRRDRGGSSTGAERRRKRLAGKGLLARKQEQNRQRNALLAKAHIDVRSVIYPGVTIELGIYKWTSEERMPATRFRWDAEAQRIVTEPL